MSAAPPAVSLTKQFRASWAIQWRIVRALLLRETLTRYGRHNIGFLWLFVEPMIFTLGVTTIWSYAHASSGSALPIVAFALTGYSTVLMWRNMPSRCITAIEPNQTLLYHRYVKVVDFYIARILLEGMGATISFALLSILFIYVGWLSPPEDVLQVIGGWLMIFWFGAALALLVGSLGYKNELVDRIWHPIAYLTFPLSGAGFLAEALPTRARELLLYVPMVNGVEYLREGYFGSVIHAYYDMGYMAAFNAILSLVALSQLQKVAHRVIPT